MNLCSPIPHKGLPDRQCNAEFVDEHFVEVKNTNKIIVDMQYSKQGIFKGK